MVEWSGEEAADLVRGALELERTGKGIVPIRLPARFCEQVPDARTREIFRSAAGVRLEVITRASVLELDVAVSRWTTEGVSASVFPAVFDLLVEGSLEASTSLGTVAERRFDRAGNLRRETLPAPVTLHFAGLPPKDKWVEVWFPLNGVVELRGLRADASLAEAPSGRPRWIHHGSSISQCVAAYSPTRTWPAIAARRAGAELVNLGVNGSCHLDQFVARAIRDTEADYISVKVGINIAAGATLGKRTFGPALHGFLDTVREGHPDTPLLVISPIICPPLENRTGPLERTADGTPCTKTPSRGSVALTLRQMRELIEEIIQARALRDEHLYYLHGPHLFDIADIDELPDGVHPSPEGYVRIGERFVQQVFAAGSCFSKACVQFPHRMDD